MPSKTTIKQRDYFVNRLTSSEVAIFVGVSASWIKKKELPYGSRNAENWVIYTVEDACKVFQHFNGRKPTGMEAGKLLFAMGADDQLIGFWLIKLFARQVIENKDRYDKDL